MRWAKLSQVAAVLGFWFLMVVSAHGLAHRYHEEISSLLPAPLLKLGVTILLVTLFCFLVVSTVPRFRWLGLRITGVILFWVTLIIGGHSLSHLGFHDAQAMLESMRQAIGLVGILLIVFVYAVALALPFVPALELGILIMAMLGPTGAVAAYMATLIGLVLAFAVGKSFPEQLVVSLLNRFGIAKDGQRLERAYSTTIGQVANRPNMSGRIAGFLLRYRYPTLALLLNLPGNSIAGGGGGLALLCGASRQFNWRGFVITVAVAVSPIPLMVVLGLFNLEPMMEHHGYLHNVLTYIGQWLVHE